MKKPVLILIIVLLHTFVFGQNKSVDSTRVNNYLKFNYKSLIIPTAFMGYGFIGIKSDKLKSINQEIHEEVNEHIDSRFSIDDFSQYTPFLSVYGLNALGVKGKNNFKDRSIIIGTAYLIMGTTVFGLKKLTHVERPDGSSNTSFPSGHTANAFMGAEFLHQEYKDVSIWYGISGYVIATGTGFFRLYNDRHWFNDVVAGAGIGILSTKIAYWLQPWMKEKIFKDKDGVNGLAMPYYNGKEVGLGLVMSF